MTFTALDSMGKTSLMLDLISQRQRALGANVANVDTPGYVRKDIDFSQYIGSMNSPIETKLSTALGPSGVIEDRRGKEIDIAEELSELTGWLTYGFRYQRIYNVLVHPLGEDPILIPVPADNKEDAYYAALNKYAQYNLDIWTISDEDCEDFHGEVLQ